MTSKEILGKSLRELYVKSLENVIQLAKESGIDKKPTNEVIGKGTKKIRDWFKKKDFPSDARRNLEDLINAFQSYVFSKKADKKWKTHQAIGKYKLMYSKLAWVFVRMQMKEAGDLEENLFEASYDTKKTVNKIYQVIKRFTEKDTAPTIEFDINDLFKNYIDHLRKKIKLLIKIIKGKELHCAYDPRTPGRLIIGIPSLFRVKGVTRDRARRIKKSLQHEIIHAIDDLRHKRGEPKPSSKYKDYYGKGYFRVPMEFNSFIHDLRIISRRQRKSYNRIASKEDFKKFLEKQNSRAFSIMAKLLKESFWWKKLMGRLAREDLLPSAMKVSESVDELFEDILKIKGVK